MKNLFFNAKIPIAARTVVTQKISSVPNLSFYSTVRAESSSTFGEFFKLKLRYFDVALYQSHSVLCNQYIVFLSLNFILFSDIFFESFKSFLKINKKHNKVTNRMKKFFYVIHGVSSCGLLGIVGAATSAVPTQFIIGGIK